MSNNNCLISSPPGPEAQQRDGENERTLKPFDAQQNFSVSPSAKSRVQEKGITRLIGC